jgi:hypothetical protein
LHIGGIRGTNEILVGGFMKKRGNFEGRAIDRKLCRDIT